MSNTKAAQFAESAIALIQSTSIQEWARSERNLPHIIKAAEAALTKNPKAEPQRFATMLIATAMGL